VILKQLSQRSLVPLWGFLRTLFGEGGVSFTSKATFIGPLAELFSNEWQTDLNKVINLLGEQKHEKLTGIDCHRPLYVVENILRKAFHKTLFGFFEQVEQDPFSDEFYAYFRVGHGPPPFSRLLPVKLQRSVPNRMPYLLDLESRKALALKPLFFWKQVEGQYSHDHGSCFLFDLPAKDGSEFSFKAVGIPHAEKITPGTGFGALATELKNLLSEDGQLEAIQLTEIKVEEDG
jgi:hypothetical protein